MANCPTCGRTVPTIFEHVDADCHNWPDRGETFPVVYRDFEVDRHDWAGFQYVHKDYDGPEDNRAGTERTAEDCYWSIDEFYDEGD